MVGCGHGSQDGGQMRAHLWVVADDLLAPDSIEQNDALAVRVCRLACEGFFRRGRVSFPG